MDIKKEYEVSFTKWGEHFKEIYESHKEKIGVGAGRIWVSKEEAKKYWPDNKEEGGF